MIKIGKYAIRQYPIFSVDPFEPNFRYDLIRGERVVKTNLTFEEAMAYTK
jgi:hypothetical protein